MPLDFFATATTLWQIKQIGLSLGMANKYSTSHEELNARFSSSTFPFFASWLTFEQTRRVSFL